MGTSKEFQKFDQTMKALMAAPHSRIKTALEAEKRAKEKKRKAKELSASDREGGLDAPPIFLYIQFVQN